MARAPRSNPQDNQRLQNKVDRLMETDGPLAVMAMLTEKQMRFCEEYVKNFEEVDAVLAAGFEAASRTNASKMASNLLRHPAVRETIKYLTEKRADRVIVDVDYVIKKIIKVVDAMEKKVDDPKAAGALLRAAELLARHKGMFTEKVEMTGKDGGPIQTEEIRDAADAFTSSIARLAERSGEGDGAQPTTH